MSRLLAAILSFGVSIGVWGFAGGPASAHHSMALFGFFPITIEGTVQQFKFRNPHSILLLKVRGKNGRSVVWYLEGDAPAIIDRAGFGPDAFRPGDRLKIQVHPTKDGKPEGYWSINMVITKNGHDFVVRPCTVSVERCD